jgi:hypothetical protein
MQTFLAQVSPFRQEFVRAHLNDFLDLHTALSGYGLRNIDFQFAAERIHSLCGSARPAPNSFGADSQSRGENVRLPQKQKWLCFIAWSE